MPLTSRPSERPDVGDRGEHNPLSAAQLSALTKGAAELRVLRRAVTLARLNAVGLFVCAVLSLGFALLDASAAIACPVLVALGWLELKGARALREEKPTAVRTLLWSQALTFAAVALYCIASIGGTLLGQESSALPLAESPEALEWLSETGEVDGQQALSMLESGYRMGAIVFYLGTAALSGVYQGVCALHYRRAGRALERYRAGSAPWMRDLLSKVTE